MASIITTLIKGIVIAFVALLGFILCLYFA